MKSFKQAIFVSILSIVVFSCKKKFENPPAPAPVANAGTMTIARVRAIHFNHYNASQPTKYYRFNHDSTIECIVIADEASGNLYKTVYVKDATAALKINLRNGGGLAVGDKIRVNLRNVLLNDYGKQIQLDSVMLEEKITKLESGNVVMPIKLTSNQLTSSAANYESQLIQLDSAEFELYSKNQLFADAVNKETIERVLITKSGTVTAQTVVRTSGYSNFANNKTPCGSGKILAILGQYNGTRQLTLRQYSDIMFSGGTCPYMSKNFDDGLLTSDGWKSINVIGNSQWKISSFGDYAACSNYSGVNTVAETWLVSPQFDLSGSTNPVLNFISTYNYNGPTLQVLISSDYVEGNPNSATWTALAPTLATTAQWSPWVSSGNVAIGNFKQPKVTIGFKYTGTATTGSTWQVDNIVVREN